MKKIFSIFATASLILACSCTSKQAEQTATEAPAADEAASEYATPEINGKVLELTDAAEYAPGVKVPQLTILDFNAVWCGPCRQLSPVLDELAVKYQGRVTFVSVDVDKFGDLFAAYDLGQSIPVVLFLYPDGTRTKYVGTGELLPGDKFEALIDAALAK